MNEDLQEQPQPLSRENIEETYTSRVIELTPDVFQTAVVDRIESLMNPESIQENREHAHGMNVLGEGIITYDHITDEQVIRAQENPHETLLTTREITGLSIEEINRLSREEAQSMIAIRAEAMNINRAEARRAETAYLDELGVDGSVKLHMCRGPFDFRYVDIDHPPIEQGDGFRYVREQIRSGRRVTLALGPGMQTYTDEHGTTQENLGTYVNPGDGTAEARRIETAPTFFHIPTQPGELSRWRQYCEYIAIHCPDDSHMCFDVWVEANHNRDDNGRGGFRENADGGQRGAFTSSGRNPEEYALSVITASEAVRRVNPHAQIGINVLNVDTDYIVRTLKAIQRYAESQTPPRSVSDLVDYVSVNPYRFGGGVPERQGETWNPTLESYRGPSAPVRGRFDGLEQGSYEDEIVRCMEAISMLGVRDLRVGESGWPQEEGLTPDQRAHYNLRGWILNRFLDVPDSPYTLTGDQGDVFAFVTRNHERTATFWAYRNLNKIFTRSVRPLGALETHNPRVQCRAFRDESTGDDILAIWETTDYHADRPEQPQPEPITFSLSQESTIGIVDHLSEENPRSRNESASLFTVRPTGEPTIVRISKKTTIPEG